MKKDDEKEDSRGALVKGLETIAETVGAVAGLASRTFAPSGSPNAVQILKDDHVLVEHLFEQFEETEDNGKRVDIVRSTLDELEVHATVEEEIVYSAIRALDDSKEHQDIMDEAAEEHHVVKQLMAELREMTPQDERFAAKFTVLAEGVRHHVREEESDVLPKAEESDLDLVALGRQVAERKQQLMQKTARSKSQMRSGGRSAVGNGRVTARKGAASGGAGAQGKRNLSRQILGGAGATGKKSPAASRAGAPPSRRAGATRQQSLSRPSSGRAGATVKVKTSGRAAAGKGRASTRTGAMSTKAGRTSGKSARGGSKGAARSIPNTRSGRGRGSAGRKTRS